MDRPPESDQERFGRILNASRSIWARHKERESKIFDGMLGGIFTIIKDDQTQQQTRQLTPKPVSRSVQEITGRVLDQNQASTQQRNGWQSGGNADQSLWTPQFEQGTGAPIVGPSVEYKPKPGQTLGEAFAQMVEPRSQQPKSLHEVQSRQFPSGDRPFYQLHPIPPRPQLESQHANPQILNRSNVSSGPSSSPGAEPPLWCQERWTFHETGARWDNKDTSDK